MCGQDCSSTPYWGRYPCQSLVGSMPVRMGTSCQRNRTAVINVADKQEQPGNEITSEEGHNAHPVEPAEGAREPGEGANEPRPPHPDEPAEG